MSSRMAAPGPGAAGGHLPVREQAAVDYCYFLNLFGGFFFVFVLFYFLMHCALIKKKNLLLFYKEMYKRMNWNGRRIIKIYLFTTYWSIVAVSSGGTQSCAPAVALGLRPHLS